MAQYANLDHDRSRREDSLGNHMSLDYQGVMGVADFVCVRSGAVVLFGHGRVWSVDDEYRGAKDEDGCVMSVYFPTSGPPQIGVTSFRISRRRLVGT
jgi:hypothetical protein